jgi:hypothetical protein
VNPVGKPDAGDPHVRFDERGRKTELVRTSVYGASDNPEQTAQSSPVTTSYRVRPRLHLIPSTAPARLSDRA